MERWLEYLSALEANVERGWTLLMSERTGSEEIEAGLADVGVPDGLGPCPASLEERGTNLLRSIAELEIALETRQQDVARQLQQRPSLRPATDRLGWSLSVRM
jgi:hypothetical protein